MLFVFFVWLAGSIAVTYLHYLIRVTARNNDDEDLPKVNISHMRIPKAHLEYKSLKKKVLKDPVARFSEKFSEK